MRRPGHDDRQALQALRQLLWSSEQARIDRLELALRTPEEMARLLPEVIGSATEQRTRDLAIALGPSVNAGVRDMARREPEVFGEILAPTIGTAVRRAVADALAAMIQRLDQLLEHGLSWRSVRWRLEARRTGRPYAEIVVRHGLVFRVERMLLVHRETGLVLQEVAAPDAPPQPADQLSSMLRALSAFASEAFADAAPGSTLRSFEAGDLTIWVEHDPLVMLVAVVRGVAPEWLRELLRETAARIRVHHVDDLVRFESDTMPFAATRPALEDCLRQEVRAPPRRAKVLLRILGALALVGLALLVLTRLHARSDDAATRQAYLAAFDREPGIHVTSVQRAGDRYRVVGLRDPLAAPAETIAAGAALPPPELALEPFQSLDPRIVARRARRALAPPSSVALVHRAGTLRAIGRAPGAWIERSRIAAPLLPGIDRYDDAALRSDEAIRALDDAVAAIAAAEVRFPRGSAALPAAPALADVAERIRRGLAAATAARARLCIELVGHTDESGSAAANERLREARAAAVARALTAALGDADLRARAAGPGDPARADRRVAFRAAYTLDGSPPRCAP